MANTADERLLAAKAKVRAYCDENNTDLFVFNSAIYQRNVDVLIDAICAKSELPARVAVFLTTNGGDADAAFRFITGLRRKYKSVRLLIAGPCKSAGTLIAVGAHEIAFGLMGELGPLDVQLARPDDIMPVTSGLDLFQAMTVITAYAFETFEEDFLRIVSSGGGNISAVTASEIATQLVTGLFSPIMAQVDPLRIGEINRAIKVAHAYAERIGAPNLKLDQLKELVEGYPSHSFVIDLNEAKKYFHRIGEFTDAEQEISDSFRYWVRHVQQEPRVVDLGAYATPDESEHADEEAGAVSPHSKANDAGKPRDHSEGAREQAPNVSAEFADLPPIRAPVS